MIYSRAVAIVRSTASTVRRATPAGVGGSIGCACAGVASHAPSHPAPALAHLVPTAVAPAAGAAGASKSAAGSALAFGALGGVAAALAVFGLFDEGARCDASSIDLGRIDAMRDYPLENPRRDVLAACEALFRREPEDAAVMWRLARARYDVAEEPGTPNDEKKALTLSALDVIKEAVHTNSNDNNIHRWCGIIMSSAGAFQSTKEYIANSFEIQTHWKQAVAIEPNDASAHHLLGRWAFDVSSMGWMKRRLAATLFATPPESSYEEALNHFTRAEEIDPGFWKKNQVMLAQTCEKLGRKDDAVDWARKALRVRTITDEDKEAHKEAEELLKKWGVGA